MHVHILGIAGTFMNGIAILARQLGHTVTGSDLACYPPISDELEKLKIQWTEGYEDSTLALKADLVIVGNAIKRGMPVMEAVLNARKPYISGPQWLGENCLYQKRVLAVAGTHGKTTTSSMLAHILQQAGLNPGFLIGGIPPNFATNARLGAGDWFVIEADEYDTAFFDKRPKMLHYRPFVAILNNLEFDHADIYADLPAIQQQFHYFLRTIPSTGYIVKPKDHVNLDAVLARGCYSQLDEVGLNKEAPWQAQTLDENGHAFHIFHLGNNVATIEWDLMGTFNVENALSAVAAAFRAGVSPAKAAIALTTFKPVKRRLEVAYKHQGITLYDDFAHHPTAIINTIKAVKQSKRHQRIIAVLEFGSYTMKSGAHRQRLATILNDADAAYILAPSFPLDDIAKHWTCPHQILPNVDIMVEHLKQTARSGDAIVVMSNKGFYNIHKKMIAQWQE